MRRVIVKENYKSLLNLIETEKAIKLVKDTFELELSKQLNHKLSFSFFTSFS